MIHEPRNAVDWPRSPEGERFWAAAEEHRLLLGHCPACAATFHPPRVLCPVCAAPDPSWVQAAGTGTVFSHTTVFTPFYGEAWAADVPYVVLLVDLDEGVRLLSRLVGDDAGLRTGARVRVAFRPVGGRTYPFFALDHDGGA